MYICIYTFIYTYKATPKSHRCLHWKVPCQIFPKCLRAQDLVDKIKG